MAYRERRAKRREWLAQERDALERSRAERWARNEQWRATWHNVRLALRIMLVLMVLAVCGAIAF